MEDFDYIQCDEFEPEWMKYGYPSEEAYQAEMYAEWDD